jgi:hypothetical protein
VDLEFNEVMFRSYFGFAREEFRTLLNLIKEDCANNSDGIVLTSPLQLCATLRILKGGSYLDTEFSFQAPSASVGKIVADTCKANNTRLENINLVAADKNLKAIIKKWSAMQKKWHKTGIYPDDVKASDDILFGEF